jgi:MFS family permease
VSVATENPASSYRWVALGILTFLYVLNFLDRQIFSVLQESIKHDLLLSDTQLGLLGGLAFAVLYATLGIPIARMADRHNRSRIITICLAVWSAMTALCGAARGFVSLALVRVGVGIGEAGCNPCAHSLIADYFGRHERSTALAVYQSGGPIGVGLGLLLGGFINAHYGWRVAFMAVGLPGLFISLLVWKFLKEPPRGMSDKTTAKTQAVQAPFWKAIRTLWNIPAFRHILFANAVGGLVTGGASSWMPSFYIRTFSIDTATLSVYLALASGLIAGLATFAGGPLGDWLIKKDLRWMCWLPCATFLVSKGMFALMLFQSDFHVAIIFYCVLSAIAMLHLGAMYSLVQSLAPLHMRALAISILVFFTNLIGLGMGPLGVGIISDYIIANHPGVNSLRWALLLVNVFAAWAIIHFYLASRSVRADMAAAGRA